ncbi:MAG: aminotransferase class III-fold pyridoxal phosphate-dependent enzyme [Polyangiaceae bacterium]
MPDWTRIPDYPATARLPRGIAGYMRSGWDEAYPLRIRNGAGARVWDTEGREFVDWVSGKGAVTLGHAHPAITRAVAERMAQGSLLPGVPEDYELAADALASLVPAAERVVFAKNGADAVNIALRLARVHSGRDLILSAGYHGWDDRLLPGASPVAAAGAVVDFGYHLDRARASAAAHSARLAAVLVTPEPAFFQGEFLHECAALAKSHGALFIVDEVRCGMRLSPGGAHQHFGVSVDLAVLSKGLANGVPLSAVVGRAEVLDAAARTFVFGTYYGDALGLAAARATIEVYRQEDVSQSLSQRGARLMRALEGHFLQRQVPAWVLGPESMPTVLFQHEADEAAFYRGAAEGGVLFFQDDAQCPNAALSEDDIAHTDDVCARVVCGFAAAERSTAPPPEVVSRYAKRRMIDVGALE